MNYKLNAFPIQQGKVNLTSGAVGQIVVCVEDGDLTVTWADTTTSTVSCVAGNAFDLRNAASATIASGTFHSD